MAPCGTAFLKSFGENHGHPPRVKKNGSGKCQQTLTRISRVAQELFESFRLRMVEDLSRMALFFDKPIV